MPRNPFATSRTQQEIAVPDYPPQINGRYAAPSVNDNGAYSDTPQVAWSPTLRTGYNSIPDTTRLGGKRRDYRPDADRAPDEFWGPLKADRARRHSVERIDADGWREQKGITAGRARFAPNPRAIPVAESRP